MQETVKVHTMNNYLGIGIDAELSLAFHLSREHNPDRCTSRLRNKALYFKAGVKKMTSKSTNLNQIVQLEVDHEVIELPSIKGLIFLNISRSVYFWPTSGGLLTTFLCSWAAGTKPWGSATSRRFQPPSIGDGLLEVIGVGGVPHMVPQTLTVPTVPDPQFVTLESDLQRTSISDPNCTGPIHQVGPQV